MGLATEEHMASSPGKGPRVERKAWRVAAEPAEDNNNESMRERLRSLPRTPSELLLEMLGEISHAQDAGKEEHLAPQGLINLDGTTAQVPKAGKVPHEGPHRLAPNVESDTIKVPARPKDQLRAAPVRATQHMPARQQPSTGTQQARNGSAPATHQHAATQPLVIAPAPQPPTQTPFALHQAQATPVDATQEAAHPHITLTSNLSIEHGPQHTQHTSTCPAAHDPAHTAPLQAAIDTLLGLLKAQQWPGSKPAPVAVPGSTANVSNSSVDLLMPDVMHLLHNQPGAVAQLVAGSSGAVSSAVAAAVAGSTQAGADTGSGPCDVIQQVETMQARGHNLLVGAAVEAVQALQRVVACQGLMTGLTHLKAACQGLADGKPEAAATCFDAYHATCSTWQAAPSPLRTTLQPHSTGGSAHPAAHSASAVADAAQLIASVCSTITTAVSEPVSESCKDSLTPGAAAAAKHRSHRWRLRTNPMYEGDDDDVLSGADQKQRLRGSTGQLAATCTGGGGVQDQQVKLTGYRMRRLSELQSWEVVRQSGLQGRGAVQGDGDHTLDMRDVDQGGWVGKAVAKLASEVEALAHACYCHWLEQYVIGAGPVQDRLQCQQLLVHMQKGRRWLAKVLKLTQQRQDSAWNAHSQGGGKSCEPLLPELCIRKQGACSGVVRLHSASGHAGVLLARLAALSAQLQGAYRATVALLPRLPATRL